MKYLLSMLMVLIIASCGEKEEKQDQKVIVKEFNGNVTFIAQKDLPKEISKKGKFILARKWTDINGDNLLVAYKKGPYEQKNSDGYMQSVDLFVDQYVLKDGKYEILWDIIDAVRDCEFDIYIGLIRDALFITDLNKNGITETTILYKYICTSDVSPYFMKLMMHENDTKMGLRGNMWLSYEDKNAPKDFNPNLSEINMKGVGEFDKWKYEFGRYKNEDDFSGQPIEFLNFAKEKWIEFFEKTNWEWD